MVTETFRDWFKEFVKEVKERPLLIIWDGRLTHVSVDVIIKASTEGITIVKYPLYVTCRPATTTGCYMFWAT